MHLWNTYSTTDMSVQSVQNCDQLQLQHKSRFCTPFVPSQCTAKLCNHEELRLQSDECEQFILFAGRLSTCQAERCSCRAIFLHKLETEMSRCSVPQTHQSRFLAAHTSLRHNSVDLRNLHFLSRLLRSVTLAAHVIMILSLRFIIHLRFTLIVRKPRDFSLRSLDTSGISLELQESLDSSPPNVTSPEWRVSKASYSAPFISLAAVIEHRHQYRVLLRVTTPIAASSDIIYIAVFSRQLF